MVAFKTKRMEMLKLQEGAYMYRIDVGRLTSIRCTAGISAINILWRRTATFCPIQSIETDERSQLLIYRHCATFFSHRWVIRNKITQFWLNKKIENRWLRIKSSPAAMSGGAPLKSCHYAMIQCSHATRKPPKLWCEGASVTMETTKQTLQSLWTSIISYHIISLSLSHQESCGVMLQKNKNIFSFPLF